ncbi:MAG: hypothetical protein F4089_05230 [Gammaproteobacteria bacterium]|nr:hypothetical protein [Gammaproteobacteria bacterium]MYJ74524.1 hypothetical protein [Gammaproteobacteria bacterium]
MRAAGGGDGSGDHRIALLNAGGVGVGVLSSTPTVTLVALVAIRRRTVPRRDSSGSWTARSIGSA